MRFRSSAGWRRVQSRRRRLILVAILARLERPLRDLWREIGVRAGTRKGGGAWKLFEVNNNIFIQLLPLFRLYKSVYTGNHM